MVETARKQIPHFSDPDRVLERITLYNAGAGSGKTYTITQEIVKGIKSRLVAPEKIVATTFTSKAAHEIAERIQIVLGEGHLDEEAEAIQLANMGTVHSVCFRLLERFVFENGSSPRLDIIDEEQSKRLLAEAVEPARMLFWSQEFEDVLGRFGLEEDQSARKFGARSYWKDHVKEIMNLARTYHLGKADFASFAAESFASLAQGLGTPLDEGAFAQEVREAVDQFMVVAKSAKSTKVLQDYEEMLQGFIRQGARVEWSQWESIASKGPAKIADGVREVFAQYPRHPQLHRDFRLYIETVFTIAGASLEKYQEHKSKHGLVDFNDMEEMCLKLLEREEVLEELSEEIDLLVVDEFQDTSPIQLAIFLKLATLAQRSIFVGDLKQAIYGFRGTDPSLMLSLQTAILEKFPKNYQSLGTSYRSAAALVNFANASFVPAFSSLPGVALKALSADERVQPNATCLAVWELKGSNAGKRQEELADLIKKLLASGEILHVEKGATAKPLAARDIAILVRTRARVEEIAQALRAQGISVLTPPRNILEEPEVVLALAALRCAVDGDDMLARAELINMVDAQGVAAWLGDRIRYVQARGEGKASGSDDWQAAHPLIAELLAIAPLVRQMSPAQALDLVIQVGDLHGRVSRWDKDPGRRSQRLHHIELLRSRASQFEENARRTFKAISHSGFLRWVENDEGDGGYAQVPGSPNAVRVMTYHGCKGLEFPCVILADLEKEAEARLWNVTVQKGEGAFDWQRPLEGRRLRLWPWIFAANATPILEEQVGEAYPAEGERALAEAIEEAKRLLYVGVTRARDYLILTRTAKKVDQGWEWPAQCLMAWEKNKAGCLTVNGLEFACHEPEGLARVEVPPLQVENLRWFSGRRGGQEREILPRALRASAMEGVASAEMGMSVDLGVALEVADGVDRRLLGVGLHHVLAYAWPETGEIDRDRIRGVLREYGLEAVVPEALACEAVGRLRDYVMGRFSVKACYPEYPFVYENAGGQMARGRIDLLVDCGDEFVLIDHKTFRGDEAACQELALGFSGQLACYRDAVEAGAGKRVGRCFVYFVLQGRMVEVLLRPWVSHQVAASL